MPAAADRALKVLGLLDLTSLEASDTEAKIADLCRRAVTPFGKVAAVCVYPRFARQCRVALEHSGVRVAAVVNFPDGGADAGAAGSECRAAVAEGAQEIDMVLPFEELRRGKAAAARKVVAACRKACGKNVLLKVILETGVLAEPGLIASASRLAIAEGADFIKTSTGKRQPAATPEAARVMLEAIRGAKRPVGFKAAGGVRSVDQAQAYVALAEEIMGAGWCAPATFRIGASGLLDDVLRHLGGAGREGGSAY
jgi:deoxyribose-phosphate aldolase